MSENHFSGLEPASVFSYFEALCRIPHGSGNTGAISDYLVSFARKRNLRHLQDEKGNVIIFQPGTAGYENHPPVILQGHMDMVCEKDPQSPIDMEHQGLEVRHDGEVVFAEGTTLGGDDGIALAYVLALMDDPDIPHPPLEAVFTVDEEVGMLGADALDASPLSGRTLINLDSEDEGIFTVSCAGGTRVDLTLPVQRRAVYGPCVLLKVDGLQGGHSGAEIHRNRANANKVMGLFLSRIQELMPVCITSLSGGSKDNAIPRSCQAKLVAMGIGLERINDVARNLQEEIRREYDEPDTLIEAFDLDALGGNAVVSEDSAKIIGLLCGLPNGVQALSTKIPGLVQTSLNLGILRLNDALELTVSVRSSVEEEKEALVRKLSELSDFYGASFSRRGDYPAWEYRDESPLRDLCIAVYREMYGSEPEVLAIHAGLECGLLSRKLPGLDCISFGPQMHDIHTSRETLEIRSVERVWQFLRMVLERL